MVEPAAHAGNQQLGIFPGKINEGVDKEFNAFVLLNLAQVKKP